MAKKCEYPDAREYYPKGVNCRSCGNYCFGIMAGPYNPHKLCNDCAVPIESDGEYFRDADGSVSYA